MPILLPDEATLCGFCSGSYVAETPSCPACGWEGGLTLDGVLALHVEEPGPVNIWIDTGYEGKLDSWRAYNGPTPGLIIAQPCDWVFDEWCLLHTVTTGALHATSRPYSLEKAREAAAEVAKCCDWLGPWETICEDGDLQLRVQAVLYLAWRSQFPPTELEDAEGPPS